MKKNMMKWVACFGAACAVILAAASWYDVCYNDARLVKPMDFSVYAFQPKDLPMIGAVILLCVYFLFLSVLWVRAVCRNIRKGVGTNHTRRIDPRLGLLGFAGFLGFIGFWTYRIDQSVYPFMFFIFFGFFGFFYEGKMSDTLMDERFRANREHAQLVAMKIAMLPTAAALILCQGGLFGHFEYTIIAVSILLSLSFALTMFLSEYLLYYYRSR